MTESRRPPRSGSTVTRWCCWWAERGASPRSSPPRSPRPPAAVSNCWAGRPHRPDPRTRRPRAPAPRLNCVPPSPAPAVDYARRDQPHRRTPARSAGDHRDPRRTRRPRQPGPLPLRRLPRTGRRAPGGQGDSRRTRPPRRCRLRGRCHRGPADRREDHRVLPAGLRHEDPRRRDAAVGAGGAAQRPCFRGAVRLHLGRARQSWPGRLRRRERRVAEPGHRLGGPHRAPRPHRALGSLGAHRWPPRHGSRRSWDASTPGAVSR